MGHRVSKPTTEEQALRGRKSGEIRKFTNEQGVELRAFESRVDARQRKIENLKRRIKEGGSGAAGAARSLSALSRAPVSRKKRESDEESARQVKAFNTRALRSFNRPIFAAQVQEQSRQGLIRRGGGGSTLLTPSRAPATPLTGTTLLRIG